MDDDILKKIERIIKKYENKDIDECFVVYLLIEIRKLIDIKLVKNKYKILYFFCNWVAHYELSKKDAKEVLLTLNTEIINGNSLANSPNRQKLMPNLEFKKQINEFFIDFKLPADIFSNYVNKFILKLIDVLIDCPLHTDNKETFVESFCFIKDVKSEQFSYSIKIRGAINELNGSFYINI